MVKRLRMRVRQLREARGLTQEAFAEQADIKYKHYQSVEAGRKPNFTMAMFEKMANGLGVDAWELLIPEELAPMMAETQAKYGRRPGRPPRKK